MAKLKIKIIFFILFYIFFNITNVNATSTPKKTVSGMNTCDYQIEGYKTNSSRYDTNWTPIPAPDCNKDIVFGAGGHDLSDGIYKLHFKSTDLTTQPGANIMTDNVKGTYRIDTTPVECILNTFTMFGVNNQYYNNGKLYYNGNGGNGKFTLDVTCSDVENGNLGKTCFGESCVSGIKEYNFPSLLGSSAVISNLNDQTNNGTIEKSTFKLTYEWSGAHNDAFDILNYLNNFVIDNAGNGAKLSSNSTTKVIIVDPTGNNPNKTINNITSLRLTPDKTKPSLNGVISFKSGNNAEGLFISSSIGNVSRYMAALENRTVRIPKITDDLSGLRGYNVTIEGYESNVDFYTYTKVGSKVDERVTSIELYDFEHNFRDVSEKGDYNNVNGYREYNWYLETYMPDMGGIIEDKICDMVNNCTDVNTPDFKVVANIPDVNNSDYNFDSEYNGLVSNYYDEYHLYLSFKDKYNNEVVPVSGVKKIDFVNNVENTLGLDQISNPDSGNGVGFSFTDGNGDYIIFNNNGFKEYTSTLTQKSNLDDGKLNIYVKSAVPTYNEYKTASDNPGEKDKSLYGPNLSGSKAKLKYDEFKIDITNQLTSYSGVGEFTTTGDSFVGILPNIRFDPIISFNYIGNIYPLVEGQVKNMDIKNEVLGTRNPSEYLLNIYAGTNNNFVHINDTKLSNGNISKGNWNSTLKYNNYKVKDTNVYNYTSANGKMGYTTDNNFSLIPQTIGGITNEETNIALYSTLAYTANGKDVILPGIQTGFNNYGAHAPIDFQDRNNYDNNSSIIFSEIQISGITQTNNSGLNTNSSGSIVTNESSTEFNDFSKISLFDIKTDINRNISLLLKSSDISVASSATNNIINNLDTSFTSNQGLIFKGGDVLYIKDRDVDIDCGVNPCEIKGKKTIIIENGNLTVNSDMYYTDDNSILGIALIGNTSNGNTSQLRINENITNGVGIVYAEGPIVSVNEYGVKYDGNNVGDNLINQLYWKGSFTTKNTIGGSINDSRESCPYGTFEYESSSCTQEVAQGYDLIYLRRYARVNEQNYYLSSNNPMGDGKVPLHYDEKDVRIAGGITIFSNGGMNYGNPSLYDSPDNYNSPLIVDYDPNIQSNPPYVFEK